MSASTSRLRVLTDSHSTIDGSGCKKNHGFRRVSSYSLRRRHIHRLMPQRLRRKTTAFAPLYAACRSRALFVIFPSFVCRRTLSGGKSLDINRYASFTWGNCRLFRNFRPFSFFIFMQWLRIKQDIYSFASKPLLQNGVPWYIISSLYFCKPAQKYIAWKYKTPTQCHFFYCVGA